MALGSLGSPCIYGSQCLTLNAQCIVGYCSCTNGYFYKDGVCGKSLLQVSRQSQYELIIEICTVVNLLVESLNTPKTRE